MTRKAVPFWDRVDKETGRWYAGEQCWDYRGTSGNQNGHKSYQPTRGKAVYAHIHAYRELVGPIPPGLVLDHLCERPCCVNPAHLEPKTQRENVLRGATTIAGINSRKTHCVHGHPFDEANTYWSPGRGGVLHRNCRACHAARERRRAADRRKDG